MINLPKALDEIKKRPQWVCYKLTERPGSTKKAKKPMNPTTGYGAKADDPSTWGSFEKAVESAEAHKLDGVGFEFGKTGTPGKYVGIDIDNCINEDGVANSAAVVICREIGSYTELSPSGNGLHIIARGGTLPAIGKRNDAVGLEVYNNGRFFTITGKSVRIGSNGRVSRTDRPAAIREASEAVQKVCDTFLEKKEEKAAAPTATAEQYTDDNEVLRKMLQSKRVFAACAKRFFILMRNGLISFEFRYLVNTVYGFARLQRIGQFDIRHIAQKINMSNLHIHHFQSGALMQVGNEGGTILGLDVLNLLVQDNLGGETFASVPLLKSPRQN